MKDDNISTPGEEGGDSISSSAQMEVFIKRIRDLEGQVNQLTTKLERVEGEKEELRQTINKSKRMFPREFRELERMEEQLKKIVEEEEKPVLGTVEGLKKSLCQVNRGNVRKEAIIKRLTARLAKLRRGEKEVDQLKKEKIDGSVERDAVEIFPEEIWQMILVNVSDPQDRWSCYNTCPLFRRLLHQWKTTWAFEQALPYLFPHLKEQELGKCRLVSKGWKGTVDDFLQDHPSYRPHNEQTCNPRLLPFVDPQKERVIECTEFWFGNEDRRGTELNLEDPEVVNTTRRDLAMWKTATLIIWSKQDDQNEENEEVWNKIYTFLRTFGEHIWYLYVDALLTSTGSPWATEKMLQLIFADVFGLVPNLRKLTIEGLQCLIAGYRVYDVEIEQDSLPDLPHLETVEGDLYGWGDTGCGYYSLLFGVLLKYHTQLQRLKLDDSESVWEEAYQLPWPKLTELHLSISSLDRLAVLQRMEMPNLTKLGLVVLPAEGLASLAEDEHLSKLLQVLNALSETTRLSTLRLHESVIKMLNVLGRRRRPLAASMPPSVKTLELNYASESIIPHPDYRFLLCFPHLENLNVIYNNPPRMEIALRSTDDLEKNKDGQPPTGLERRIAEKAREQEVVEVNKFLYSGEMYRSNIWELLPRLKVFTFQWQVYTRGGYEDYCSRKKRIEENNY